MTVRRTAYASPVEALAALIHSLVAYEQRYQMSSADFYARYQQGEMGIAQMSSSGLEIISTI